MPGSGALDVFPPKHRFQFRAAHFAAETIHFIVGDGTEFPLQFLGQFDAEFTLEKIGNAAFARLAIDSNNFPIFASDIGRVDCEVRHVPELLPAAAPFGEALLDRILMRATEGGKDEFPGVGMSSRHRHAGAAFIHFANRIQIFKAKIWIDAVHVQVERDRYDVEVAGSFAVAE